MGTLSREGSSKSLSSLAWSEAKYSNTYDGEQQCKHRELSEDKADDSDNSVVVIKTIDNKTEQLYIAVIEAFNSLLSRDDKSLICNLVDISGKTVVKAEHLINIIALACDVESNNVIINYIDEETGCLHKFNPIKSIASIKVNNKDMFIQYNTVYNMICNKFNISLEKCIVNKIL